MVDEIQLRNKHFTVSIYGFIIMFLTSLSSFINAFVSAAPKSLSASADGSCPLFSSDYDLPQRENLKCGQVPL
jgi:hypothetical protein